MTIQPQRTARTPWSLRRTVLASTMLAGFLLVAPTQAIAAPGWNSGPQDSSAATATRHDDRPSGPGGPRLSGILTAASRDGRPAAEIAERIAALGPVALPAILDVAEAGCFHERIGPNGRAAHPLSEAQRAALHLSLEAFEWRQLRAELSRRLAQSPSLLRRTAVLQAAAAHAPLKEIAYLLQPIATDEATERRALTEPVADAFARVVARGSGSSRALATLFRDLDAAYLMGAIEGAARPGGHGSLLALAGFVGVRPKADPLVLIEIAQLAKTVARPAPAEALVVVRRTLSHPDTTAKREAVKAAGRLDDVAAIEKLIELLTEADAVVAKDARLALERLSAERFGADADAWSKWHADARSWLRDEAPGLLGSLRGADRAAAARALLRIARFRVFRHDLVGAVAEAVAHGDDATASLACVVLGHFATDQCVPVLIDALDHPSLDVRKSAYEALTRATGVTHGDSSAAWRAAGW